jgi:hypothetical protein
MSARTNDRELMTMEVENEQRKNECFKMFKSQKMKLATVQNSIPDSSYLIPLMASPTPGLSSGTFSLSSLILKASNLTPDPSHLTPDTSQVKPVTQPPYL